MQHSINALKNFLVVISLTIPFEGILRAADTGSFHVKLEAAIRTGAALEVDAILQQYKQEEIKTGLLKTEQIGSYLYINFFPVNDGNFVPSWNQSRQQIARLLLKNQPALLQMPLPDASGNSTPPIIFHILSEMEVRNDAQDQPQLSQLREIARFLKDNGATMDVLVAPSGNSVATGLVYDGNLYVLREAIELGLIDPVAPHQAAFPSGRVFNVTLTAYAAFAAIFPPTGREALRSKYLEILRLLVKHGGLSEFTLNSDFAKAFGVPQLSNMNVPLSNLFIMILAATQETEIRKVVSVLKQTPDWPTSLNESAVGRLKTLPPFSGLVGKSCEEIVSSLSKLN